LGYSRSPCAKVLSVPGFFAILARFPGEERFILAGKGGSFPCAEASLSHLPD